VNRYVTEEEPPEGLLRINEQVQEEQIKRLKELKRTRDNRKVSEALAGLRQACRGSENVMPHLIEASRAYATEQEMCDVYREVFGEYHDPGYF